MPNPARMARGYVSPGRAAPSVERGLHGFAHVQYRRPPQLTS